MLLTGAMKTRHRNILSLSIPRDNLGELVYFLFKLAVSVNDAIFLAELNTSYDVLVLVSRTIRWQRREWRRCFDI
jgi:hypothetical protein